MILKYPFFVLEIEINNFWNKLKSLINSKKVYV